jgi:hypothetical protein
MEVQVKLAARFFPQALFVATISTMISSSLGTIYAQQRAPHSGIPGAIDGSKTPELIPDSVAFRMFFEAVSEPPLPTPEQVRRQRAKLRLGRHAGTQLPTLPVSHFSSI